MLISPAVVKSKKAQRIRHFSIITLAASLFAIGLPSAAQATYTIFGLFPIITTNYGVGTLAVVPPTTNSPGPWTYTSSNEKVATVSGGLLNILSAGSSTITATQAASSGFTARSRSTPLRVNQGVPIFGAYPGQSVSILQKTFALTPPTSSSNGMWTYSSSNSAVASIIGNTVTLLDGGTVTITATQSMTLNWQSASTHMALTVIALDPMIGTFGSITIMKDSVRSLTLSAPSSLSPGAWTFASSNPAVATIYGTTLTPLALGTSTITAHQDHWGNYGSASISMTLTVQAVAPTIGTFPDVTAPVSSTPPSTVTLVPPTSKSQGAWTFTSSDTTVASTAGTIVTLYKPGRATITATQSPWSSYGLSSPVSMTLTVVGTPTIGAWSNIQKVIRDPDFPLTLPTSDSPGIWTYVSANSKVVDVVAGIVKVVGAGQTTITATQAATPIWASATAQVTVNVLGDIPTLGAFALIVGGVGDTGIAITPPSSNSQGVWTYTSSDATVAVINGTSLSIVGVGTATITAMQNPAGIYSQSNVVQTTVTGKPKPVVGNFQNLKVTLGDTSPTILLPTSTSSGAWSFTSSKPAVATINNALIQIQGVGVSTITATQAAAGDLAAISKTFTIDVLSKPVAKPKPRPTPTPVQKPSLKVSVAKGVITVSVIGAKATVTISGIKAKIGKNTVKAGKHSVVITIDKKVVYRRTFTIDVLSKPVAKPTHKPTHKPTPVRKPSLKVTVAKRVITVSVNGAKATVTISGIKAKIGKNAVKAGKRTVQVKIAGKVVYKRTFTIK